MNNLIKELAVETGLLSPEVPAWMCEGDEEQIKQFAEMLILNVINNILDCTVDQCTRSQIVEELKTAYGVKE